MNKTTNTLYSTFLFKICTILFFFVLLSSCDPPGPGEVLIFNTDDEKNLGQAIHTAMINSDNFNIMPESMDLNNYVKSVRTQLVGTNVMEHRSDFDWNVYVILNDDVQDCFATVGGNIYIYSGLMKTLNNEAQFMSLLAHEFYYADNHYHTNILRDNYAIGILLDVSRGNDEVLALEMLKSFYMAPRNPNVVESADGYGMGVICATNAYAQEMRMAIEGAHQANNTWYQNHKQPTNASFTSRTNSLMGLEMGCGGTTKNAQPYLAFLEILP